MNREQEKNYKRNYFARAQWGIIKSKWWTKSCFVFLLEKKKQCTSASISADYFHQEKSIKQAVNVR